LTHFVLPRIGPMALLADSQLLFGGDKGEQLSQWVGGQVAARQTANAIKKAVYIGASNGNAIEFYLMATDICRQWGIESVEHVKNINQLTALSVEDIAVVILAGGDVAVGWGFLSLPSVRRWLDNYTQSNGLIIGISAGAIHLASAFSKDYGRSECFLEYCSANIAAHEEQEGWPSVCLWQQCADDAQSLYIGLPFGGGMLVEQNATKLKESRPIGKGYRVFEKYTPII